MSILPVQRELQGSLKRVDVTGVLGSCRQGFLVTSSSARQTGARVRGSHADGKPRALEPVTGGSRM